MNYQAIKLEIAAAERLARAGELAAADRKIRDTLAAGATLADLDANLSPAVRTALRDWTRRARAR